MLAAQSLEGFSGLNLLADPDELGANGCVDGIDFDLSPGKVRSRSGYTKFTAAAGSHRYQVLGSTGHVVGVQRDPTGNATGVALNSSGAVLATTGTLAGQPRSVITFGTPVDTYVYLPIGTSDSTLARWDGASWSYPAMGGSYGSYFAAVQPSDNRLVLARSYSGNASRVRFSDAGAAETYGANNYVDLAPGKDTIRGMAVWKNELYVVLNHFFCVFYGNSVDAAGEPIFNYRAVDVGIGARPSFSALGTGVQDGRQVVAGADGVYFIAFGGVYRTTGGPPEKISRVLDPLFSTNTSPFFSQSPFAPTDRATISAVNRRIYVTSIPNSYTLVYDIDLGQWMVWSLAFNDIITYNSAPGVEDVLFSYADGTNDIGQFSSATTDDGTAINATYRSALYDLGTPNDKVIRASEVHGTGTVGFSVATNREAFPTARPLTLGTAPTPARAYDAFAPKPGEFNSYKLSSVDGAWEVDRITHYLRPSKATGLRAA